MIGISYKNFLSFMNFNADIADGGAFETFHKRLIHSFHFDRSLV